MSSPYLFDNSLYMSDQARKRLVLPDAKRSKGTATRRKMDCERC